jgi:phospholipid-binding lipoprotein MlaA
MPRRFLPAKLRLAAIPFLALTLLGCVTVPPAQRDARDPWQGMNRGIYKFNDAIDRTVVTPVARTYLKAPQPIRTGVTNFFNNATYPDVIVNALLQGQIVPFARDTGRFVVNTTLGIAGIFDPASHMGLAYEDRDFGQTFGKWGIPPGPFLVLPLLGPSDVRDGIGRIPDSYSEPWAYIKRPYWYYEYGSLLVFEVSLRASILPLTDLAQKSYDPYAFERNAYLQNRDFMVKGEKAQGSAEDELKQLQEQ